MFVKLSNFRDLGYDSLYGYEYAKVDYFNIFTFWKGTRTREVCRCRFKANSFWFYTDNGHNAPNQINSLCEGYKGKKDLKKRIQEI